MLLPGLLPCGIVCLRGSHVDALVALETAGAVATVALLLLAEGFHRSSYFELPLTFAFLAFLGSLVFVRLMERSL